MTTATYTLQDFVKEAQQIADRGDSVERQIAQIAGPLERIIQRQDCLLDLPENDEADPDKGFVIHRADNLTVMAVVWQPDSGAPVHNHNGWAMEGVISGVEFNRNYQRVDDGLTPWYAELEELEPTRVPTGATTVISEPPADIHAVEIREGKTLAIHVYGLDLLRQWRYRFNLETNEVEPFAMRTRREL
ncbi:MAG: cysteine dioxygenase family protein [Chloroflexota bacterium]|nr:cysteine dioxygenase family protein [Chloroflexota bacterium]